MKKTIWAIVVGAMLAPMDANIPNNELSLLGEKPRTVESFKSKSFEQEISDTLTVSPYIWDGNLKSDSAEFNQEISKVLDVNNYWINQSEQERCQQRIQKLIPQIKEPIILWDLTKPNVAITIDDGYWVKSIEYMLDLFEKYDVKATFFVIWECLKLHPELWRKAAQQWHEICNHTMHHNKYFKTWNEPERFEGELLEWEDAVKMVLWKDYFIKMKKNFPFFRFPWMYGIREKVYLDILKKYGYIPIGWWYTENPKDGIVNNGEIFLWHFKDQDTLNVRKCLDLILQNGKYPKTMADLITTKEYVEEKQGPIWWDNFSKKKNEVKNGI